jgi:hypothetical protein
MFSLTEPAFFTRLRDARRVLVAGAGGGFDVYAGLPLALALRSAGKEVHLANLSFSDLHGLGLDVWLDADVAAIGPDTVARGDYFPERTLARWLARQDLPSTVYAFPRTGVRPLRAAYRTLVGHLGGVDALVLVDGGTDILMQGDEHGLGTPEEDMASLAAVQGLDDIPRRIVACLGFGVDAPHGVNHSLVLENLAALDRAGAPIWAHSPCRARAGRAPSTSTRWSMPGGAHRSTRASSTAPSPPPCAASSVTSGSRSGPGTANSSSTR